MVHAEKHVEHAEKHVDHAEKHVEHAGTGKRPPRPSSEAEQQHKLEQSRHIVIDGRKQSDGLIMTVLASAIRVKDAPRSIKELSSSCFPNRNEGWWTAKPGSEQVVDPHDLGPPSWRPTTVK